MVGRDRGPKNAPSSAIFFVYRWRQAPRVLVAVLIAGFCLIVAASGADSPCDPALKPPEAHPLGYRSRGDRCEGVYIQPVAGTTMAVTSFNQGFSEYDLRSGQPLTLAWVPLGEGAVHLRGVSTKRRLYYRMDSELRGETSTYTWPINILAALNLSRREIGVAAWTSCTVGGAQRIVYLPLRVHQGHDATPSSGYQLELIPNRELTEVYVSIVQLDEHGNKSALIQDAAKLGYGYYPAERVFFVSVPALPAKGLYHLELGAVLAGGGSSTSDLWFFHAGP